MDKIALPKKIEFKQDSKSNSGSVVIEPLFPGYGMTLGNSIRRVLLSSLPGSAVVGVKIKGAKHEFMPLSGVKEDVIDIILNLKSLRFKMFSKDEDIVKLEVNVKGKKKVTAGDIEKNSQVEIVNPDLVIANTTESTSNLSMEIYISAGRGYSFAEKNKKDIKEIDYMDIDSIFSPILGVGLKVENVRVGKMTNWDKLILDIDTDGTISVEQAFNDSVKVLLEQFNSLISIKDEEEVIASEKKTKKTKK